MFDKFEVLESWKLSWDLSFLLLGVSDGHIFFHFSNYCPKVLSAKSTKWHGDERVRSLHTYHPTMTWSTILLVMRTELDLTVMLLFVKSCLPTSRSCRTSLSCASSSRGAENGIWRKTCKEVLIKWILSHATMKIPIQIQIHSQIQISSNGMQKPKTKCVNTFLLLSLRFPDAT